MAQETRLPPETRKTGDGEKAGRSVERVGKTTAPKPRRDVGLAWLVLLGLMILAAGPLLVDLGQPAAWSEAEALSLAISNETHQRKTPMTEAQTSLQAWTPVYQGASRWDLPPGGVWLHMVMYSGLDVEPGAVDADQRKAMRTRARLGSVIMALLFVAAVYWAGHSVGGVTTGAFSALVAMTMPLIVGFGRHATADCAALAWSTLSIAAALWAMRPLRASPAFFRQFLGWLVCGLALGFAALTAGPRAVPVTLLCTITLAMLCPRRIGHIMGLIASSAVAALVLTPWALHAHDHDPNVWQLWINQLTPDLLYDNMVETLRRAGWRLSLAGTLCGLWLVWLIPAVSQPFSTSTGKARRRMLLGWGWLVTAAALLAFAPGPSRIASLLIGVAPASLAIGLVIQQFHDLSAEGRHARLWLICRWIGLALMFCLAIALPLLGYLLNHRPELVEMLPTLKRPLLSSMHWSFYAGAALALLLVSALATRFALGHHPGRTTACLALWLLIIYSLAAIPIARGSMMNHPAQPPASPAPIANR